MNFYEFTLICSVFFIVLDEIEKEKKEATTTTKINLKNKILT